MFSFLQIPTLFVRLHTNLHFILRATLGQSSKLNVIKDSASLFKDV